MAWLIRVITHGCQCYLPRRLGRKTEFLRLCSWREITSTHLPLGSDWSLTEWLKPTLLQASMSSRLLHFPADRAPLMNWASILMCLMTVQTSPSLPACYSWCLEATGSSNSKSLWRRCLPVDYGRGRAPLISEACWLIEQTRSSCGLRWERKVLSNSQCH